MYSKSLFLLTLLICGTLHAEVIEINSDAPYSSGIVKFTNEDLHFSTGLTLRKYRVGSFDQSNNYYFSPIDTSLYTTYVLMSESAYYVNDFWGIKNILTDNSKWDQIKSVSISEQILDSIDFWNENAPQQGHILYNNYPLEAGMGNSIGIDEHISDILVCQDTSGNFIKWQIAEIKTHTNIENQHNYEHITGIYLKWEIDSLGNGKFPCSPVSNKKIISDSKSSKSIKHIQANNRLTFPAFEALHIAIYKSNGQLLKVSDGITNFIDLSGISKGLYIAQIKSNGMKKSVGFRVE